MKINLYLPDKHNKKSNIMLSISFDGKRYQISTYLSIEVKFWDFNKQKVKSSYQNHFEFNNLLDALKNKITSTYLIHKSQNIELSKDEIKQIVRAFIKNETETQVKKEISFIKEFEKFIEIRKNNSKFAYGTIQRYRTALNHIIDFENKTDYRFTFDGLNQQLYDRFCYFLNTEKNLVDNTVGAIIKTIKVFLNWAYENSLIKNNNYVKIFKVIKTNNYKISLTKEELQKIEEFNPKSQRLQRVKDMFLLQCYTSLRYSDLAQLNSSNINLKEGYIIVFQHKTKEYVKIPIHNKIKSILGKYPELDLPVITNQKMNDYLKELCKEAGIDTKVEIIKKYGNKIEKTSVPKYDLVSTHTGRRTCITLLLKKGLLPEEIMKISGHKSRVAFERYVQTSEEEALKSIRSAWDNW